jgi:sugar/nucleoside kinase (ribokinase family)/predicted NBD/HSP70 family sugar kinase
MKKTVSHGAGYILAILSFAIVTFAYASGVFSQDALRPSASRIDASRRNTERAVEALAHGMSPAALPFAVQDCILPYRTAKDILMDRSGAYALYDARDVSPGALDNATPISPERTIEEALAYFDALTDGSVRLVRREDSSGARYYVVRDATEGSALLVVGSAVADLIYNLRNGNADLWPTAQEMWPDREFATPEEAQEKYPPMQALDIIDDADRARLENLLADRTQDIVWGRGGPGYASSCAAAQFLGTGAVKFVGTVGVDENGARLVREQRELGIDTSDVESFDGAPTSGTLVVSAGQAGRGFAHNFGADARLDLTNIRPADIRDARVLHIGGTEITPEFFPQLVVFLKYAKGINPHLIVVLDTVVDRVDAWQKCFREKRFDALMGYVDVFTPSIGEAIEITKVETPNGYTTPDDIINFFMRHGARAVYLKDGENGCHVRTKENSIFGVNSAFSIPVAQGVTVVGETGTGDAFDGGISAALVWHATEAPEEAARWNPLTIGIFGTCLGAMAVEQLPGGGHLGANPRQRAQELLDRFPRAGEGAATGQIPRVIAFHESPRIPQLLPFVVSAADYDGGPVAIVGKIGASTTAVQLAIERGIIEGTRLANDTLTDKNASEDAVVDRFMEIIDPLIERAGAENITHIHISAPGFFAPDGSLQEDEANIPALKAGFHFARAFSARVNQKYPRSEALGPIEVQVVHDGTAGAEGEMGIFGTLPGQGNLFYVIDGTGVGTRLMVNGHPFFGDERIRYLHNEGPHCLVYDNEGVLPGYRYIALETQGMHPDYDHEILPDGSVNPLYGKQDLEDRASGPALARYAIELAESGDFSPATVQALAGLCEGGDIHKVSSVQIGIAANQGNALAMKVVWDRGREVGTALATFLVESSRTFEGFQWPEDIVIGSGVSLIGEIYLRAVRRGFKERLQRYFDDSIYVVDHIDQFVYRHIQLSAIKDDTAREFLGGIPTEAQIAAHRQKQEAAGLRVPAPSVTGGHETASA